MDLPRTQVVDLGAFKMVVSLDDHDISRLVREHGWDTDQRWETSVFAAHLRPGMSVLDLGGNIGLYSMLARSVVGPQGCVVAFEPYPRSAALIRASAEANGFTNVSVVQAAVSDCDSRGKLYLSPDGWTEHSLLDLQHGRPAEDGFTLDVDFMTVDSALTRLGHDFRVDMMKIDIEGGEWPVVRGMLKVLERNPKLTIMTEFWPNGFARAGASARRYLDFLHAAGFSFRNMNAETEVLEPMTVEELAALVERNATRTFDDPVMRAWGWYTNLLCTRA
jgi:FkbM family methyltransferase